MLEGHVYIPFLTMDSIELQEHRQDPHLHPAFKVFSIENRLRRLKSLLIGAWGRPSVLRHLRCRVPFLEELDIHFYGGLGLDDTLFDGDLSSLRELRMSEVLVPWKNLANLRVIVLKNSHDYGTTQLLDLLESAPLLHTVRLWFLMQLSSDTSPERIAPLPHLKEFTIDASPPHSILLHHLRFPTGASLCSEIRLEGEDAEEPPFRDYLPVRSRNFSNLSLITAINLRFNLEWKCARLNGPSGNLHVIAQMADLEDPPAYMIDRRILRSLGRSKLLKIHRLSISEYKHPRPAKSNRCPIFQMLSSAESLRTLILIDCNNLPFILALDPEQNPSNRVLCSNMETLVLYIWYGNRFYFKRLIRMTKNRAARGADFSSIRIIIPDGHAIEKPLSILREHVAHVQCSIIGDEQPAWDDVAGE